MASSLPLSLLLQISCISLLLALLISPAAQAATCTSQTFKNNKVYSNCNDLPALNSYLHWTYNRSNSSLSIAFVAAPAKTGGWVAWAINPTAEKMAGSQALLAHLTTDGTPVVKTYNISSYSSIIPGNLSFDVWDISAEFSNSTYMIFATVKVPENKESVNQVWQVGPGVNTTTGFPERHDFAPANLRSYGLLNLVANATTNSTSNTTTNSTSNTTTNSTSNTTSGALRPRSGGNMGLFSVLLLVLGALIAF
ncbi:auxin-induced in root cultures protein 12-like [Pyrus ussuriensis x Pyrus communis]|uniref:Auxin-induced in root cultures protein 12-like n=1 Tax=Pyrus ussuriensis x Pyrus communis TaxID=2448454 RepID=A0A5N5IBL2_9ROSA|nr:auxin-induced in root cultures protein 12-like [Pyrus ussuriensis x Pyrus communis]